MAEQKELTKEERYENALKNKMELEKELDFLRNRQRQVYDAIIMAEGVAQTYEIEYQFKREDFIKKINTPVKES